MLIETQMSLKPVKLVSHFTSELIHFVGTIKVRQKTIMLTKNQLIETIKENSDLSKSELVKVTGYTSVRKDGSIKLNFTAFYQALIDAIES